MEVPHNQQSAIAFAIVHACQLYWRVKSQPDCAVGNPDNGGIFTILDDGGHPLTSTTLGMSAVKINHV